MRWSWVLVLTLVAVACGRDFSEARPWTGGQAGTSVDDGGSRSEAGSSGADRGGNGSAGRSAGTGGDVSENDDGGSGGTASNGNGGTPGMNRPPTAVFDFYRFERVTDAVENRSGAGGGSGSAAQGEAEGGATDAGANAEERILTYEVPAGPHALQYNDIDPEDDVLRVEGGTSATERGGTARILKDGGFIYTPPSNQFWGDDYFQYLVSDGESSTSGRVRITLAVDKVWPSELDSGRSNGWGIIGSESYEELGYFAGSAGDVNGDGLDDLIVSTRGRVSTDAGSAPSADGAVYVVFGRKDDTAPVLLENLEHESGRGGFMIAGFRAAFEQGQPVNGAGDLNGDGLDDLAIASLPPSSMASAPSVYVVFGRRDTTRISLEDVSNTGGDLGVRIDPIDSNDRFGASVAAAGDVNGDGYGDLVIGAPGAARAAKVDEGAAYVLLGHAGFGEKPVILQAVIEGIGDYPGFLMRGSRSYLEAGFSVAGAGDINGDGLADLVIGAPEQPQDSIGYKSAGAAYVLFGARERATVDLTDLESESDEGFVIRGVNPSTVGYSVAGAGYFNLDALEDVLTGIPSYERSQGEFMGGAYVTFGRREARAETIVYDAAPAPGMDGYFVRNYDSGRFLGWSVAAGDFDGDGWSDAAIAGWSLQSEAYMAFGGALPEPEKAPGEPDKKPKLSLQSVCAGAAGVHALCLDGADLADGVSYSTAALSPTASGDFNGDGIDDVLLGAPRAHAPRGAAYVVFGWDIHDRVQARHVVYSSGVTIDGAGDDIDDPIVFSGGDILRISGGHGIDTVLLEGPGLTWDLRDIEASRLRSIERIDLRAPGDQVLVLDDNHVRSLPSSRPSLPSPLAKTLTVLGDAGDELRVNLDDFERLQDHEGRLLFRRKGLYYGLEVDHAITITEPDER